MEGEPCVFLGIKVKPGPIERHKLENFTLDHTVDSLKTEAEKKANLPSAELELIHHGKILKDEATLQDSGVKSGEMVHVVKKKVQSAPAAPAPSSDTELHMLNFELRALGCTPNAPGWTRAMQLLNDESVMNEILEQSPSLSEDCVALSILHEVELLAALGADLSTMRRGADAHPALPHALSHLTRLVRSRFPVAASNDNVPTSGFAYSLEALSDDDEADEEGEGGEGEEPERNPITQEQLAAALQAATDAMTTSPAAAARPTSSSDSLVRLLQSARTYNDRHGASNTGAVGRGGASSGGSGGSQDSLLRLLQAARSDSSRQEQQGTPTNTGGGRSTITPEMLGDAIMRAIDRVGPRNPAGTPMDQSNVASSSESPVPRSAPGEAETEGGEAGAEGGEFSTQLVHMHEMGLLDDALNVRALLICAGDVNAAINLVFSGAIGDE